MRAIKRARFGEDRHTTLLMPLAGRVQVLEKRSVDWSSSRTVAANVWLSWLRSFQASGTVALPLRIRY